MFAVQFQLKRLDLGDRTRTRQWDESSLLPSFKAFYETATWHDINMGMCRAIDAPVIDDEIADRKKMTDLPNDETLTCFTDERLMRYIHIDNPRFLHDRNTGLVHAKIKIRTGRPVNKDKVRQYSRPIFMDWAQGGGHRIFYDEMQQINQYKIGCFLNVCLSTNYDELSIDFSNCVQKYIEDERAKHLAENDKEKWSEFQNVTSEFHIFESRLRSRNKYGRIYEAPVGWIMAGNNSSVMGIRVIQKLHEELKSVKRGMRLLDRNMDIIPRPDDIRDRTLVDMCKTCNDLYVNSIQLEVEELGGLEETIVTRKGVKQSFRNFLLDMTVSETDTQKLIIHTDSKIRAEHGIILTCQDSMKDFLHKRFEDIDSYLQSELQTASYEHVTNSSNKGNGSYQPWFLPSKNKNSKKKRESKYESNFSILQTYKQNSQATTLVTQKEAKKYRPPSPQLTYKETVEVGKEPDLEERARMKKELLAGKLSSATQASGGTATTVTNSQTTNSQTTVSTMTVPSLQNYEDLKKSFSNFEFHTSVELQNQKATLGHVHRGMNNLYQMSQQQSAVMSYLAIGLHELAGHQNVQLSTHEITTGVARGDYLLSDLPQTVLGPPPAMAALPPTPKQPLDLQDNNADEQFYTPTFIELPSSDDESKQKHYPASQQQKGSNRAGLSQGTGAGPMSPSIQTYVDDNNDTLENFLADLPPLEVPDDQQPAPATRTVHHLNHHGQHTNETIEVPDDLSQVQNAIYSRDIENDNSLAPENRIRQEPEALPNANSHSNPPYPPSSGGQDP